MRRLSRLAPLASLCLFAAASRAGEPPAAAPPAAKPTFWVIPHTHWEGAVFKTREEYLEMGLPNLVKAMRLLKEQPGYRYTIDQVAYIRPFLERYPEEEAAVRRFLAEGRLQLVGGLDVMPDVNMPGGETFIRQIQYGKGYLRRKLGLDVKTGWLVDTFGQHAQLPQMLKLGGFETFWFVRGVPKQDHPAEFLWEGIDGTRIPSFYLPHSYVLMYPTPRDPAKFQEFARHRFSLLDPNTRPGDDRVGVSAADVSEPEEHQAGLVEGFDRAGDQPFRARMGIPADYEAVALKRKDWPVFRGELNPIFQGTYSSRIELKGWMRSMERRLLTAEKLGVVASWLGSPGEAATLWRAWEPVMFNETHDLASGVMTDHVYEDTVKSYEFSRRLADQLVDEAWQALVDRVDTRGPGIPIVAYNPLGWIRSDLAEVELGFDEPGIQGVRLVDDAGREHSIQVLDRTRHHDGGLKTAKVAFVARDVPALGHRVYHAVPEKTARSEADAPAAGDDTLETEAYRLRYDPRTGAITSLLAKGEGGGREVLAAPGNVVARQADRGDLWELNRGLDGGSRVAMKGRQAVPARGAAVFSDEQKGEPGKAVRGPVIREVQVDKALGNGRFATRIRLVEGLPRIEVTTLLLNLEKFVRYQVLFPTGIAGGKRVDEIPLGAIERPEGVEFPAQNWVDYSDGRRGLAILNVGLPGHVVTDGTMMISLLRAHGLGAYGFGGGYEPGMSADTGFQIGEARSLSYALLPHAGDWREAKVFRAGLEFNHPLICRKASPHEGSLPPAWGLLEVSSPDVVVSALTPGSDREAFLRVYEASGRPAKGVVITTRAAVEAEVVDFLGRSKGRLEGTGEGLKLDLGPFEIKTVRLLLARR